MKCPDRTPRIVISGTYCTGKTSLSIALSLASGIPATHALTMREILPRLFPSVTLKNCSYAQLLRLGLERFKERINSEALLEAGFISDGCPLQEWLYGSTRLVTGAYPEENKFSMLLKKWRNFSKYQDFEMLLAGFENMVKAYTLSHYDIFFHLPLEFPFVADGHRPTSECFRNLSEQRLLACYQELKIKPVFISGNLENRLHEVLEFLKIDPIMPIPIAIAQAEKIRTEQFDQVKLESNA